jgi:antirestriction protein ArdC
METLINLFGQCSLCNRAGIAPVLSKSNDTLLNGWKEKFRNDHRFIVAAGDYAQKAVDYILAAPAPTIIAPPVQMETALS